MKEIREALILHIKKAHDRQPNRGIEEKADRLADDILSRYNLELRGGKITNKNGIIQDIRGIVDTFIQAAPYILANPEDNKFVSKFTKPGPDARKKMAADTERALKALSAIDAIVAADNDNYQRSLGIIAANYLYEVTPDGEVLFARLHESGIIHPEARMTWDEIKASHLSHLIDGFRTEHAHELKQAKRRADAKNILGDAPLTIKETRKGEKTRVYPEGEKPKQIDPIIEKMNIIRRNEILAEIPKRVLPSIPESEIIREAQRRECGMRQWGELEDVIRGGGDKLHALNQVGKFHLQELADTTPIINQVRAIQPQPAPQYDGISY